MNDRIRELYEQSHKIHSGEWGENYPVFDHEKFAELIVRECAAVANDNVGAFTPGCGNIVLEHFGVE